MSAAQIRSRFTRQLTAFAGVACLAGTLVLATGCTRESEAAVTTTDAGPEAAGATVPAGPLRIVSETENASITGALQVVDFEGASDGKCLYIALGDGATDETKGRWEMTVEVPEAKTVDVWLRCYWTGTCANSVTLEVPGFEPFIIGEDGTYNEWHWVKGPQLPLDAGSHTITFVQREDDVRFDQVFLSSNSRVKPVGIEK